MKNHLGNEMDLEYFGRLQSEENKVVIDIDRLIKERWKASLELDIQGKLITVCNVRGYDPVSIDGEGKKTGYKSSYGPKKIVHILPDGSTTKSSKAAIASIYWDGYGDYLSVSLKDDDKGELYSSHPTKRFVIPHPVLGLALSLYPIAAVEMEQANIDFVNRLNLEKLGILGVQFD